MPEVLRQGTQTKSAHSKGAQTEWPRPRRYQTEATLIGVPRPKVPRPGVPRLKAPRLGLPRPGVPHHLDSIFKTCLKQC